MCVCTHSVQVVGVEEKRRDEWRKKERGGKRGNTMSRLTTGVDVAVCECVCMYVFEECVRE